MVKKKLKVFAALHEDSNAGWIWIPEAKGISSRDHIIVVVTGSQKKVTCVCRTLDKNFQSHYNNQPFTKKLQDLSRSIVLPAYYRDLLGKLETDEDYEFEIRKVWRLNYPKRIFALVQHPDNAIRIATWLALWSLVLGIGGIVIGIISICLGK